MPTPPSNVWDETQPPVGQAVSLGDDRIRELKLDIRQRLQNCGLYIPASASALSGVLFTAATNHIANEVNIYDESPPGTPTPVVKLLSVRGTNHGSGRGVVLGANLTGQAGTFAGSLSAAAGGSVVVTSQRRLLVLTAVGRGGAGGGASEDVRIRNVPMIVPAAAAAGGTILEFYMLRDELSSKNVTGIDLLKTTNPFGAGFTLTLQPSTGLSASVLTAIGTMSATEYGIKFTSASVPGINGANQTVTAGDVLIAIDAGGSNFDGILSAVVVIQINY